MSSMTVEEKYREIVEAMRARGRILVAFSGGVDSGLVLKIAHDAVLDDCLAVIGVSPSLAKRELETARTVANAIGARLEEIELHEMDIEEYRHNRGMRCYFCRNELGLALKDIATTRGFDAIVDGANLSDVGDYRPGMRAMDESGVWHPLMEFGLDKEGVRAMARMLGLSIHDKPSTPCLSSRLAFGELVTEEKLRMVEAGEDYLHDIGFSDVRVRLIGGDARIEVPREDIPRISKGVVFNEVSKRLKDIGFSQVTIDPEGYRQGSTNRPR